MADTIERIPKTLYEANLLIKQLEGSNGRLAAQNHTLSTSLSKANKLIKHLLDEKAALEGRCKSFENAGANIRKHLRGRA